MPPLVFLVLAFDTATIIPLEAFAIFYTTVYSILPSLAGGLSLSINKACDLAGVKYLGQHVFRHTFATNCYARGCDVKVLSKLLGHSDVTITYNTYIHLFGDALEEMRKVIG